LLPHPAWRPPELLEVPLVHCCLTLSRGVRFNWQAFKTREKNLTSGTDTRRESEVGTGPRVVVSSGADQLGRCFQALWRKPPLSAVAPRYEPTPLAGAQHAVSTGHVDKCHVCFTC